MMSLGKEDRRGWKRNVFFFLLIKDGGTCRKGQDGYGKVYGNQII